MNKAGKGILLLFTALVMLSSCKTTRTVIKAPLKEEGAEFLYAQLKKNELHFDWLSAKFNASYTDKKGNTDFKGQIRVRKDSLMWVTISPALGIEAIRLVVSQDSVKYVNRLNKEYFSGDYDLVSKFLQIDIDFDILQALILGNDFQFYETNSFRASIDNLEYKLSTTDRRKIRKEAESASTDPIVLLQNIWLNPDSYKITRVEVKEYMKENRKLDAEYSEFVKLGGETYPSALNFNILAEEPFGMSINYSRVELNQPMSFPFSIPGNYKRIR